MARILQEHTRTHHFTAYKYDLKKKMRDVVVMTTEPVSGFQSICRIH